MSENIKEKISNLVKNNDVCLFMKGTPDVPQCGFSTTRRAWNYSFMKW